MPFPPGADVSGFPPLPGQNTPPQYTVDPRLKAGYQNIYGTNISAGYSPVTQRGDINATIPIGDYQRQMFAKFGAYATPGAGGAPADYGFSVGFTKKIAPEGMAAGEAINKAIQQDVGNTGVIGASTRSEFFNSLTPDQLRMIGQDAESIKRRSIDEQLGVVPGAQKYGFNVGVDVKNILQDSGNLLPQPDSVGFARNYAGSIPPGLINARYGSAPQGAGTGPY